MMLEQFSPQARAVLVEAQGHARRLGHRFVGCEHLLLAVAGAELPAGEALRGCGLLPARLEREIVRRIGYGAAAGLFDRIDRDALAAIGIDLDAVRARIEASFPAVAAAACRPARGPRRSRLDPRRAVPPRLLRALRSRRRPGPLRLRGRVGRGLRPQREGWPRASGDPGRRQPSERFDDPGAHLPLTQRARRSLANAVREAQGRHQQQVGIEHLALGLIAMRDGMVPVLATACGASAPALRAAILDRYRLAG